MEHTKLPWKLNSEIQRGHDTKPGGGYAFREISSEHSILWVARVQAFHESPIPLNNGGAREAEANAEFIVRAVNSHVALVDALEQILSDLPQRRDWLNPDTERFAKSALALARGGSNG